eukprot:scaffold2.g7436.t1
MDGAALGGATQGGALGPCRPAAWSAYFPAEEWEPGDRRAQLVAELLPLLRGPHGWRLLRDSMYQWHSHVVAELDWQEVAALAGATELGEALAFAPAEGLACLAAAVHEAVFGRGGEAARARDLPHLQDEGRVVVRLHNQPPPLTLVSAVRADLIGSLISMRGTVVRCTPVRPLIQGMEFICGKCGEAWMCPFPDGRYAPPVACATPGCRSKYFAPHRANAACADWQRVSLQGLPRDERAGQGCVPTPVDVELLDDLVGSCSPGDVVTVVGLVKVINGEAVGGKKTDPKQQCIFTPFVEALSVTAAGREHTRGRQRHGQMAAAAAAAAAGGAGSTAAAAAAGGRDGDGEGSSYLPPNMQSFSQNDLSFVCQFTELCEGDQLRTLVHSLCPTILGQELVKAGLLLALFGGVRKRGVHGAVPVRGDIHCLMVGDPGMGKSQLLQASGGLPYHACMEPLPYLHGAAQTPLSAPAVIREGGEFAFDAGALVLADRGVCCIDEFDKCTGEHQALLGAMEQQEVSVAKAGLVASLPARTTVLAAANPVDGSFNRAKGLMDNLKLSPAMLSRFDLLFLLVDRPDADRDQRLSEHIMALHSGIPSRAVAARSRLLLTAGASAPLLLTDGRESACGGQPSLLERLQQRRPDDDPVPPQLLRKYIAYARQYCHPRLSTGAKAVLKAYYLHLRAAAAGDPCALPVTARQLESLIRLTEARARCDLREEASAQDAEDVVEIMRASLDGLAGEGPGHVDFARGGGGGRPGSLAAERLRFLDALKRFVAQRGTDDVVAVAEMYGLADQIELAVEDMPAFIDRLNEAGDLLKKGNARYQVCGCRALLAGGGGGGGPGGRPGGGAGGGGYGGSQGSKRSYARSYGGL